jgi:tocopherol O-methyltransferase
MISCPSVEKRVIRTHYNLATPFYRLLWGRHIHHGLWEGSESPAEAQLKLTQTLSREAGLQGGERVLDVGCGMGGSSIYLAKTLGCHVTGITLSSVQRRWASVAARLNGVGRKTRFLATDAESVEFEPASFDAVWSVECTEHLFDKPAFFRRVAGWLRPGGRVAICAWQAGDGHLTADAERQCTTSARGSSARRWEAARTIAAGSPTRDCTSIAISIGRAGWRKRGKSASGGPALPVSICWRGGSTRIN